MAISKQTALDMLRWFKAELDDSVDTKIATIAGGDKNVIEAVKVNNSALPVSNKAVNIDLSAYAKTADVNSKLATIQSGQDNIIEAISIDGQSQTVTNKTAILDLSDYAKSRDVADALNSISSLSAIIYSLSSYTLLPATPERLGGIKIGSGLVMDDNDVLHVAIDTDLPKATTEQLGGIIVGEGLSVTDDGVLSAQPVIAEVDLPIATKTELGGVIVGNGLSVTGEGVLSVIPPESVGEFFLTPATEYDLGGVIVGGGLSITEDGVLSVTATGGQSNVIENISIDGKLQTVTNKTAILSLSAYAKKTEVGSGVRMKGSVNSFANLPTDAVTGDLYNIKQAGGSDGAGIPILAGDNVVFTDKGTWDVMAGFVDTSSFLTKSDFTDELKEKLAGLSNFVLSAATTEKLGGVIVGSGLSITKEGVLSADATSVFLGARETQGGGIGLVPAPLAGQNNLYLRGDGYWARFPTESLNVIVGGGSLNGVNVEAITYPPNQQGMLWMDVGDEESLVAPCLRLRHNDYEYIFKADNFTETTVNASHSTTGTVEPRIYYLGTVSSTINGGLWYTLEDDEYPTLQVLRKWTDNRGNEFEFTASYNYDLIHYKAPPVDGLSSYWLWRPNFSGDIFHREWTTTVPAPVVEKTDHGIYALRNLNTALTNTTTASAGWTTISKGILVGNFTIDFWLSWNADDSNDSTGVFGTADILHPILKISRRNAAGAVSPPYVYFGIYNTSFSVLTSSSSTPLKTSSPAVIEEFESALESNAAKRIHVAIVCTGYGKYWRLYLQGKYARNLSMYYISTITIFPYMVGTETEYRPLYIDHFRIWDKIALTNDKGDDFEPPKPEDYIIW